jgi:hypothetical protein
MFDGQENNLTATVLSMARLYSLCPGAWPVRPSGALRAGSPALRFERMEQGAEVLVRDRCPECEGEGERRVEKGTGHVAWSALEACSACEGTGRTSRWVPVTELQAALDGLSSARSR